MFRFKGTLNKEIHYFLVYRYTSSNCNLTNHGKTYCHFFVRDAGAYGCFNLTGKRLKNIQDSAVSDHLLQCHYTIDFDDFDVLSTDASKCNLLLKESLLIKCGISV